MPTRFESLFPLIPSRDYQYLDLLMQEYPDEGIDKTLQEMTNNEILETIDTYIDGISEEIKSIRVNTYKGYTEEGHIEYLTTMRRILPRLRSIRKKLVSNMKRYYSK